MNIDDFPFNELLEEVKDKDKIALLEKILTFMYRREKENGTSREDVKRRNDTKRIMDAYQALGELKGCRVIIGEIIGCHDWRIAFEVDAELMASEIDDDVIRLEAFP